MTTTGDTRNTGTAGGATPSGRRHAERYDPPAIEPKWQARWAELGLYDTDLSDESKPRFYLLTMYPYPSGALHIGHWYIKTPTDAIARYKRMHGFNVFLPIGFDAFGLPAENAAIKNRVNPREWTMANIETMRRQLRSMGATFAWDSEVVTCDPGYYRWNQWMFVQFMKRGLAYRAVLGRGLVPQRRHAGARAGRGHRPSLLALRRQGREARAAAVVPPDHGLRRRAAGLRGHRLAGPDPDHADQLDRPLGGAPRSCSRRPRAHHAGGEELRVFTTRPDTLFGATFMVLAPEHPLVESLTAPERRARSMRTSTQAPPRTEIDRLSTEREKTGVGDRRRCDQPGQRRADPDLHRGLRAGQLRHRRDHGGARRTTSATSSSPSSSGCRSGSVVSRRRADAAPRPAFVAHTEPTGCMVNSGRSRACRAPRPSAAITSGWSEQGNGERR